MAIIREYSDRDVVDVGILIKKKLTPNLIWLIFHEKSRRYFWVLFILQETKTRNTRL